MTALLNTPHVLMTGSETNMRIFSRIGKFQLECGTVGSDARRETIVLCVGHDGGIN
jgi:hypothetical protein